MNRSETQRKDPHRAAPSLSLPKGGGAIKGIGETFTANPVTGTSSLNIPLPLSPGRAGTAPSLALGYDSGAGNGPFGFGFAIGLPAITRRTDRGVPRYRDAEESDVFVLSGMEDLVRILRTDGTPWVDHRDGFVVTRYRPRLEGLFARIERWTSASDPAYTYWRSISRDNVTTIYGKSARSRITDPADLSRIFSWLACESFDDKGNAVVYDFVAEDDRGVAVLDPSEATRTRGAQRYLKRVRYGNRVSQLVQPDLQAMQWLFELVLDYGDHDQEHPDIEPSRDWPGRPDPFSSYRAGFEIRTHRRCHRFLMFHHFEELGTQPRLVRALAFDYDDLTSPADAATEQAHPGSTRLGSFLRRAQIIGFADDGIERRLPPLELSYSRAAIDGVPRHLDPASVQDLPQGIDGGAYRWVDLDGEGLSGLLAEQGGGWWYKANLGGGVLGALQPVAQQPNVSLARAQLLDLAGDGRLDLVCLDEGLAGFYERAPEHVAGWAPFTAFRSVPVVDLGDPDVRLVDLTGDGIPDILITDPERIAWHRSLGEDGFAEREYVSGPRVVFGDATRTVFLADMSGDGLSDLVQIRNGCVTYWPNLGHGRFGAMVTMAGSPRFDAPERFDPRRIRLADIDGSGVTDVIYLGSDGPQLYFNRSGNSFSTPHQLSALPRMDDLATVTVADLLGNGTACLVWSTVLPGQSGEAIYYVDLMGGHKPHLLVSIENNLGAHTRLTYAASTKFYLEDRRAGRPWATRLPFPVHVLERSEVCDDISGTRFARRFIYHDGYYDGVEREFRGFAEVEQLDTEELAALGPASNVDASSHVPPTLTRTHFHVGAERGSAVVPVDITGDEQREAARALKGAMLRQEVFALDGTARESLPYVVTEQVHEVRLIQPRGPNRHVVFFTHQRESIASHSERNPADARVVHAATLDVDAFGNVLLAATVAYGRQQVDAALPAEAQAKQAEIHIAFAQTAVTNAIDALDDHRTPASCEAKRFVLTGLGTPSGRYTFHELATAWRDAAVIDYEVTPSPGVLQKRLVEHTRILYRRDDLSAALPLGQIESRGLEFEVYQLAFTHGLVAAVYGDKVKDNLLVVAGGYVHFQGDSQWWIPSGRLAYSLDPDDELATARAHFFAVRRYIDPAGSTTHVTYDPHDLMVTETLDALGHRVRADNDYRVMAPRRVTDANGNRREVCFDALGLVVGTAVMGKVGESLGDSLEGFVADLPEEVVLAQIADPLADPHAILGRASTRVVYDVFSYQRSRAPAAAYTIARETHDADLPPDERTATQHSFAYTDGYGRIIQSKVQAAHATWEGSGWAVFNNKGQPVRRFEPFFSESHHYEPDMRVGVGSILFYDPMGRRIGALRPDHSWEKKVFGTWREEAWDVNDTILLDPKTDPQLGPYFARLLDSDYRPTWFSQRIDGGLGPAEQAAAERTAAHAGTPVVTHTDSLARSFLTITNTGNEQLRTMVVFDAEGNERAVVDALDRTIIRYDHDMLGNRTHQASMEAGERWMLSNVLGKPVAAWNSRGHHVRTVYDPLHRPIETRLGKVVIARTVYGELATKNQVGKVVQQFDQAGIATTGHYDFKGNLLLERRQLAREYKGLRDWDASVVLDDAVFSRSTQFDALDRPMVSTTYDGSVFRPSYNAANLVERVDVNVRGAVGATTFVAGIEYNARRQRIAAQYGNGVRCEYEYDPRTFRLGRLRTTRDSGSEILQDLRYTYDPAGNVTRIADDAQQTIYFSNQVVTATADYRYDATYRLISAEGREHIGQVAPPATTWDDASRTRLAHPHDGQAMRRYLEQYHYDGAGNLLQLVHQALSGSWTRDLTYGEASQLESSKHSNRLSATTVSGASESYTYDAHGNTTSLPHLSGLSWNFLDQLETTSRQVVTSGVAETTYYVYDVTGQRIRKVTERQNGTRKQDRIYLDGFEIFREFDGAGTDVTLERETLHVTTGQRVALVETRTHGTSPGPAQLVRYQLGDHLGSASLELDASAQVISYEEYYPYGSTSYQAVRSQTETPKRYRYSGMERDDETGLAYHGKRYYAPWLARWTSCDPIGLEAGVNLYGYVRANPVGFVDPNGTDDYLPWWYRAPEQITEIKNQIAEFDRMYAVVRPLLDSPEGAQIGKQYGFDEKDLSLLVHAQGERLFLVTINERHGAQALERAREAKWNAEHSWVDKLVTSYQKEKAYLDTKAQHRDWEVKPNLALNMTGEIVKATPQAAGNMWAIFSGGIRVPPKPPSPEPGGGRLSSIRTLTDDELRQVRGGGPGVLGPGAPASVTRNGLSLAEASFAQEIVDFRGGSFVGVVRRSAPGIDGHLNGVPASLKSTEGGLVAVLRHASRAETSARNAGFSGVELFIRAPNVGRAQLVDFARGGPLAEIPTQGTISAITVFTREGVVRLSGGGG